MKKHLLKFPQFGLSKTCNLFSRNFSAQIKPFEEIPGPTLLPFIGSMWKYFPVIGDYDFMYMHKIGSTLYQDYGPVVKEVVPNMKLVHVYNPEDIELMYKKGGNQPVRKSFLSLEHFRNSRPNLYNNVGVLAENGEAWWELRKVFQKHIGPVKNVRKLLKDTDEIAQEFIEKLIKPNSLLSDSQSLASRFNFEIMWKSMFGERHNSFDPENLKEDSLSSKNIKAVIDYLHYVIQTDNTEMLWKHFHVKTKPFKIQEEAITLLETSVMESIRHYKNKPDLDPTCLLAELLNTPNVDEKYLLGTFIDIYLGSLDTTASAVTFVLYQLATNERAQSCLRDEIRTLLPDKSSEITEEILDRAHYTKAVIKETLRLNPVAIAVGRIMPEDVVFSSYKVPKDTMVIAQHMIACRQEKNFPRPDEFLPERWIRGSPEYKKVSPYLMAPFSMGLRSCLARRRAEQNLNVLTMRLFRDLEVRLQGEQKMDLYTPLILKPVNPILFSVRPV